MSVEAGVTRPTETTFNAVCEIVRKALIEGAKELNPLRPVNPRQVELIEVVTRAQLTDFLEGSDGWNSYCIVARVCYIAPLVGSSAMSNTSIMAMGEQLRNLLGS